MVVENPGGYVELTVLVDSFLAERFEKHRSIDPTLLDCAIEELLALASMDVERLRCLVDRLLAPDGPPDDAGPAVAKGKLEVEAERCEGDYFADEGIPRFARLVAKLSAPVVHTVSRQVPWHRKVAFYFDATNLVTGDSNDKTDMFVRVRDRGTIELITLASDGTQGNRPSVGTTISADGRFVAFQARASADIFVRDRFMGTTERICDGVQGNRFSFSPAISADGNFVAFASDATNLVADDTNARLDIFVCDGASRAIERIIIGNSGAQGNGDSILPAINADGRVLGFKSLADNLVSGDRNGVVDVFVRDQSAGTTERISVKVSGGDANDFSFPPSISNDGRYVASGSFGTSIVWGDTNHPSDVFVRDRRNAFTILVDKNAKGELANRGVPDIAPAISGDGKQIAFVSFASNLVTADINKNADVYSNLNDFQGPNDSDCLENEHCRGGACKKKRPCDDTDPVIDRHACFDRETCIDNLCECGGDCNLDGFVFVTEINKAVNSLNGLVPVNQCTAVTRCLMPPVTFVEAY